MAATGLEGPAWPRTEKDILPQCSCWRFLHLRLYSEYLRPTCPEYSWDNGNHEHHTYDWRPSCSCLPSGHPGPTCSEERGCCQRDQHHICASRHYQDLGHMGSLWPEHICFSQRGKYPAMLGKHLQSHLSEHQGSH